MLRKEQNYFEVTLSNSKASFFKKAKSTIKEKKNAKNDLYLIFVALVGTSRPKIC